MGLYIRDKGVTYVFISVHIRRDGCKLTVFTQVLERLKKRVQTLAILLSAGGKEVSSEHRVWWFHIDGFKGCDGLIVRETFFDECVDLWRDVVDQQLQSILVTIYRGKKVLEDTEEVLPLFGGIWCIVVCFEYSRLEELLHDAAASP